METSGGVREVKEFPRDTLRSWKEKSEIVKFVDRLLCGKSFKCVLTCNLHQNPMQETKA